MSDDSAPDGRVINPPRGGRYLAVILITAALYVVTGRLGLQLAHVQENATLIWPPTGLSIAVLILFGRRVWPGVFLGAALTTATLGTPPLAFVLIAVGNTLEAVVGATLLERLARFEPGFARSRDVVAFLFYGAFVCTVISATFGASSLYLVNEIDGRSFGSVWLIWWLGDAGGAIVVGAPLLVGFRGRPHWTEILGRAEAWLALVLLVPLLTLAFSGLVADPLESLLPALLVFPVLVWAGLRLGPRGAVGASFVTGVAAVLGTAQGVGPFGAGQISSSMLLLWTYISTLGAVAMILAAAVAEREEAGRQSQRGEEERAKLAAQVQHAQRLESLGLMAGGVAHDFNNLLVSIRGNAELLVLTVPPTDKESQLMLREIELASAQAANLCHQLLTYAGHDHPEKEPLDLATVIDELLPLLRTTVGRTVDLQVEREEVPLIEGDRTRLVQVFMNLVINAVESITTTEPKAGGWVRVSLSQREVDESYLREAFLHSDAPPGPYVVLTVSDCGAGMSPETLTRIFDPFFSTKNTGRGLGMAAVLGIINSHGGAIKVRSRLGEGTTFEVLLPVATALAQSRGAEVLNHAVPSSGLVLVADDEPSVRDVICKLLSLRGFEVLEAEDGIEAVELFEANRDEIALVILDVSMPGLSGPEALTKIHEQVPGVPAILVSGFDEGRVDSSSDASFLQKPFAPGTLIDLIARVLGAEGESR